MKKISIIIAAMAAALSISSCKKENLPDVTAQNIKINITIDELHGLTTKAVKTGWVDGDKINLWFGTTKTGETPTMVLRKDGSSWVIDGTLTEAQKTKISTSSTFSALYESSNNLSGNYRIIDYDLSTNKYLAGGASRANNLTVVCRNINFTFDNDTLTANITGWKYLTAIQITVTDVPDDFTTENTQLWDEYSWLSGLIRTNIYNGGMTPVSSQGRAMAVESSEARSLTFYFMKGAERSNNNIKLRLTNSTTTKYFNKSDVTLDAATEDNFIAIKIPFSKFE